MLQQRWRPVMVSVIAVIAIWAAAMVGYAVFRNAQVTPDKVRAYVASVEFSKLSPEERAKAIQKLAAMLNALSLEERQKARLERVARTWFNEMTESEKAAFIEATMPTGFKQMLSAFEQLPDDKRKRAVDDALKRLRETRAKMQSGEGAPVNTNAPVLSDELQAKIRTIGLQTFYSQSSAQTKAELAPVLEEMQHVMESGRFFHQR